MKKKPQQVFLSDGPVAGVAYIYEWKPILRFSIGNDYDLVHEYAWTESKGRGGRFVYVSTYRMDPVVPDPDDICVAV